VSGGNTPTVTRRFATPSEQSDENNAKTLYGCRRNRVQGPSVFGATSIKEESGDITDDRGGAPVETGEIDYRLFPPNGKPRRGHFCGRECCAVSSWTSA